MKSGTRPDPIDKRLGELLRLARSAYGLSQEKFGTLNGLTFQQIQKYERARNRVSVSRLVRMAESLGLPTAWFIERLNTKETDLKVEPALLHRRELPGLINAYVGITDKGERRLMCRIMTLLAAHGGCPDEKAAKSRRRS